MKIKWNNTNTQRYLHSTISKPASFAPGFFPFFFSWGNLSLLLPTASLPCAAGRNIHHLCASIVHAHSCVPWSSTVWKRSCCREVEVLSSTIRSQKTQYTFCCECCETEWWSYTICRLLSYLYSDFSFHTTVFRCSYKIRIFSEEQ